MKPTYVYEDRRVYLIRLVAFAVVTLISVGVWQILQVMGSHIFVAVCALGLLYSLYSYFRPRPLLRMDARGAQLLSNRILVPWQYIYDIRVEDGQGAEAGRQYIVARGYSPRAEEEVEWWRLPAPAGKAAAVAAQIRREKERYSGKGTGK